MLSKLFTRRKLVASAQTPAVESSEAPGAASAEALLQTVDVALQHHHAGRITEAEQLYRQVLSIDPGHFNALYYLGILNHQIGRPEQAVELIAKAVSTNPADASAHNCLGELYQQLNRLEDARASHEKARSLTPNHADTYFNLGNVYRKQGKLEDAIGCYEKALTLDPQFIDAQNALGCVLGMQGRPVEALACFRKVLAVKPDDFDAHNNIGSTFQYLGKPQEAIAHHQRALALRPDDARAQWYQSMVLLLVGDYANGFRLYEKRLEAAEGVYLTHLKAIQSKLAVKPRWQGESLRGKTLLVWTEQGSGDSLMMLRYVHKLLEAGVKGLVLYCGPELYRLARGFAGSVEAINMRTMPPPLDYDYHCPIMSLPFLFGTSLETIPDAVPYLYVPADMRAKWTRCFVDTAGLKVGLAWAGSQYYARDIQRSVPLKTFEPLIGISGITFVSLQKEQPGTQLTETGWPIRDWMNDCEDYLDTAALVESLDLVISVDTAVVHLAGALGKPVWLLNRFESEWRWLLEREDSPWYPTMRIFRQPALHDWDSVIRRLVVDLSQLVRSRSQTTS